MRGGRVGGGREWRMDRVLAVMCIRASLTHMNNLYLMFCFKFDSSSSRLLSTFYLFLVR